ncbi:MAG: hypothetical protein AAF483_13770 [Planctomycetota bacterium]
MKFMKWKQLFVSNLVVLLVVSMHWSPMRAQDEAEFQPLTAPKLFPDKTLAYFRIDDVQKLKADLERSSIGKLSNDEKLKPILNEFYGSLVRSADQMEAAIGLNLDELLSIPSGEMAVALLPSGRISGSSSGNRNDEGADAQVEVRLEEPAVAMMLDAGEEISSIKVLLARMEEAAENLVHEEKAMDRLTLHRFRNPDRQREQFAYFIDEGVIIACTNADYAEKLAEKWLGKLEDAETLADNRTFTSLMSRCVGTEGERPQVSFYIDPLAIVRQFTPRSTTTQMTLALLPALGVDGVEAVGGSWIVSPPDFDSITHFHIQLGSPRRAILGLLRPKSGSTEPEEWVPESVASYSTINWDIASTVQAVERLYNQFRGKDALQKEVFDRGSEFLDLDVRQDILDMLEGRITIVQGFVKPVTINSGSNVYAIKIENMSYFRKNVLNKVLDLIGERAEIKKQSFGKLKVSIFQPPRGPRQSDVVRQPEICITTIDDYLVIADSKYMLREVASCVNGTIAPLIDSLEYQLISERISAQLQDKECSAVTFARPEESLELFYKLAADPANQDRMRQFSEGNGFFQALLAALDKHELPPFSVISKYLAPSGGYLLDDESGMHYMQFGLRRE